MYTNATIGNSPIYQSHYNCIYRYTFIETVKVSGTSVTNKSTPVLNAGGNVCFYMSLVSTGGVKLENAALIAK